MKHIDKFKKIVASVMLATTLFSMTANASTTIEIDIINSLNFDEKTWYDDNTITPDEEIENTTTTIVKDNETSTSEKNGIISAWYSKNKKHNSGKYYIDQNGNIKFLDTGDHFINLIGIISLSSLIIIIYFFIKHKK